jgi:hypothetical protein
MVGATRTALQVPLCVGEGFTLRERFRYNVQLPGR